jgi:iron-sulfur cluster repair protein YtfE (RIC family)
MPKATDELLKDHKMIRKIMKEWEIGNPRFGHIHKTLMRVVLGHAWFEDQVFFPAMEAEPAFARRFIDELYQEHKDIDSLLKLVRKTPTEKAEDLGFYTQQLRVILETHFTKEEEALFPICEKILDEEGLNNLSVEMRRRQHENRMLVEEQ